MALLSLKARLERLEAKADPATPVTVVLVWPGETHADAWRRQHGDTPVPDADAPEVLWVQFVAVDPPARPEAR